MLQTESSLFDTLNDRNTQMCKIYTQYFSILGNLSELLHLWTTKCGQYDKKDFILAQKESYHKDYQSTLDKVSNIFHLQDDMLYPKVGN